MSGHYDFKKEWSKTKKQLAEFSKELSKIAKKGEVEVVKFSKQSKLHVDSTAISLRKEHLYHLIGKEYAQLEDKSQPNAKLKGFLSELSSADKEQRALKRKIQTKKAKRKTKTAKK